MKSLEPQPQKTPTPPPPDAVVQPLSEKDLAAIAAGNQTDNTGNIVHQATTTQGVSI